MGPVNVYRQRAFYYKNNIKDIRQPNTLAMSSGVIKVSVVAQTYVDVLGVFWGLPGAVSDTDIIRRNIHNVI